MNHLSSAIAKRTVGVGIAATLAIGLLVDEVDARSGETKEPMQLAQYAPYPPTSHPYPGRPACDVAGGTFRGAARGAAGGAIIGGIAGNPGRGAAVGAGIGALGGAARRAAARDYGYCY
jgi:hypothetical protein